MSNLDSKIDEIQMEHKKRVTAAADKIKSYIAFDRRNQIVEPQSIIDKSLEEIKFE